MATPTRPTSPAASGIAGVEPHLRGQVEGHRQAGLAGLEQQLEALVGGLRGAEAGVLAHGPVPAAVHVALHAARVRERARVAAADVQRRALVELGGLDVENAARPIGGETAGLLHDEGERIGLVQQAQLAARRARVAGIREHAAAEQVAMEVGHERAHVAHVERLAVPIEPAIATHERARGSGQSCSYASFTDR
jgi:hypothetical protein